MGGMAKANLVQRQEGDKIVNILKEGAMVREIQSVTEKRFKLADSTPVNKLSLCHSVGFCTSTDYAKDLLQGKILIPFDLDDTTTILVEEVQHLYAKLKP